MYAYTLLINIFNGIFSTNLVHLAPVALEFMKMEANEPCPDGTEITTKDECESAFKQATQLDIYPVRKSLQSGSWSHVPYRCSYQHEGDGAFHWNTKEGKQNDYRMICKIGEY